MMGGVNNCTCTHFLMHPKKRKLQESLPCVVSSSSSLLETFGRNGFKTLTGERYCMIELCTCNIHVIDTHMCMHNMSLMAETKFAKNV